MTDQVARHLQMFPAGGFQERRQVVGTNGVDVGAGGKSSACSGKVILTSRSE
jgi:hypothetical protein